MPSNLAYSEAPVPHPQLQHVADEGRARELPHVSPETGALLHTLVRATGASHILEIGTGIGYATLWLASALPQDGMMISMEADPGCAARARAHLAAAGLGDRASVMVGDAARFLHKVSGPFDLIFEDCAAPLDPPLLGRLAALLRPGGWLITHRPQPPLGNGVAVSVKVNT